MPRAFIAILLDPETRDAVTAELERLRPLSRAVAWVPRDNLHVTLRFLGDQTDERLADALAALDTAAAGGEPFTLGLHGLGAFPGLERPRIFWVGIAEGALAARGLQARLESELGACGFPLESRPWHPHLTVGRVFDDRRWRREITPALRQALAQAGTRPVARLPIRVISLMKSDLGPAGARYTELASRALGSRIG
jgi:RNA 2',3'-cyclic 3'-phosphodiesterase